MRGISRELVQRGVYGHPLVQPDLGPGVIVEAVLHVYDAHGDARGNADGAGEGGIERRMLVAVAHALFKHLQGAGDADHGLLADRRIDPVVQLARRFFCVHFPADHASRLAAYPFVIALDERVRFEIVGVFFPCVGQPVGGGRARCPDRHVVTINGLAPAVELIAVQGSVPEPRGEVRNFRRSFYRVRGDHGQGDDVDGRAGLVELFGLGFRFPQQHIAQGAFLLDRLAGLGDPGDRLHSLEVLPKAVHGLFLVADLDVLFCLHGHEGISAAHRCGIEQGEPEFLSRFKTEQHHGGFDVRREIGRLGEGHPLLARLAAGHDVEHQPVFDHSALDGHGGDIGPHGKVEIFQQEVLRRIAVDDGSYPLHRAEHENVEL